MKYVAEIMPIIVWAFVIINGLNNGFGPLLQWYGSFLATMAGALALSIITFPLYWLFIKDEEVN